MLWTFSTSVPPDVSFPIPSAPHALLAATMIFMASHRASPAPQGQAILWSQAHRANHAFFPATALPANRFAATVPSATTALIQPVIRRFVPQALTALPRAALLSHVNQASCARRKGFLNKCLVHQAIIVLRVNKTSRAQLVHSPRQQAKPLSPPACRAPPRRAVLRARRTPPH
jgi:hypothetical protein